MRKLENKYGFPDEFNFQVYSPLNRIVKNSKMIEAITESPELQKETVRTIFYGRGRSIHSTQDGGQFRVFPSSDFFYDQAFKAVAEIRMED